MQAPGYAAIGIYPPGETRLTLMSSNGRVVVFDTPEVAKDFMPLLGNGRTCRFAADDETAHFLPVDPEGVNRAVILTHYDVYNLPPGLPVRSEAKSREWKRHVIWSHLFTDCGQMEKRPDGSYRNAAIGEA